MSTRASDESATDRNTAGTECPPVDTAGALLTPERVRLGLTISVAASTVGMAFFCVGYGVTMTMFMVNLGASGFQLGVLAALAQLTVLAQLPASSWVEKMPTRKPAWFLLALTHRLLWFVPALVPLLPWPDGAARIWTIIGVVAVSSALGQASAAPWFAWMADLVPDRISGRFWGIRQSMIMVFFVAMTASAGVVLDLYGDPRAPGGSWTGFVGVMLVAAILGTLDILIHRAVPEPRPPVAPVSLGLWRRVRAALADRDFRSLTLAMGMWVFICGMAGPFGMVHLKRVFGASYSQLSAIAVAGALGTLLAGVPFGRLIDRRGARSVGALLIVVAPLLGATFWFFLSADPWRLPWRSAATVPAYMAVMLVAHLIGGALFSGVGLCQMKLANALSPREGRTVALATHWSVVGLMSTLGPIVGGMIMDLDDSLLPAWRLPMGEPLSFFHLLLGLHTALACLVAMPLMLRVRERGVGLPRQVMMALLWLASPLRVINSLYLSGHLRVGRRPKSRPEPSAPRV